MGKKRSKIIDVLEIDVTEEMIKAGVSQLRRWDRRTGSEEWAAEEIFKAMMAARQPRS